MGHSKWMARGSEVSNRDEPEGRSKNSTIDKKVEGSEKSQQHLVTLMG